jgi:hypothetical protein
MKGMRKKMKEIITGKHCYKCEGSCERYIPEEELDYHNGKLLCVECEQRLE